MKMGAKSAIAAAIVAAGVALSATSASAYIACNREGYCWHVRSHATYRPAWGVVIHPDNWRWRTRDRYQWREHEGRGYWRNGIWIQF